MHDPELDRHELEDDRGDYVRRPEDSWQFSLSCCSPPSQNEPHFGASLAAIQRILLLLRKRFCRLLCARAVKPGPDATGAWQCHPNRHIGTAGRQGSERHSCRTGGRLHVE